MKTLQEWINEAKKQSYLKADHIIELAEILQKELNARHNDKKETQTTSEEG